MPKIALLEFSGHYEVIRSYTKIFLANDYNVSLFVSEYNYKFIKDLKGFDEIQMTIWYEHENFDSFIITNLPVIEMNDIVISCSEHNRNNEVIQKKWQTFSYQVVHDLHNTYDPILNLSFKGGLYQFFRITKYLLSGYFIKKKRAIGKFDGIIVPSKIMAQYVKENHWCKNVKLLPFFFNEFQSPIQNRDVCKIVIPGTVNTKRRDYNFVRRVLLELSKKDTIPKIELILLGKPIGSDGRAAIKEIMSLSSPFLKVSFFENTISLQDFDTKMKDADFLFLPLKNEWQYGVVNEIGGLSCISGNIGDMVRFGLPTLVPSSYRLDPELEFLVKRFEENDLERSVAMITEFISKKQYNLIKQTTLNSYNDLVVKNLNSLF